MTMSSKCYMWPVMTMIMFSKCYMWPVMTMIMFSKCYMWSVMATLIVVSCAISLQDGYSRLRYGHRLDRKMIDSFGDYSLLDCVEACLSRKRCQSVSYLGGAEYCEINYEDKTTAPNRFLESSGWTYSERNDWDKAITGSCALSNCEINQTCRPLPTAKHECVLSDCGIPYIRGADMDSVDRWDGIAIGRRLHLQCLNQYKQIGSGRLLCSTDGRWIQDLICDFDEAADCKRTTLGWDYIGKINVTKSGRTCQAWASQSPHPHATGTYLPENYCRNTNGAPTPWCYTTDPDVRFESCDIPMCDTPPLECLTQQDPTGRSYFGTQNVADTGDLCQRWDSQTPHVHDYHYLADQGNYCRNPDGEDAPWCYTINPKIRWSECIIPRC